jgi:glycosyltransferase involved in cell wall biosynthesis
MKLVWFSHFVPFPPRGGNLQRSFNLIRQMSKSYEISLVALNFLGDPPERLRSYTEELKKYCKDVQIWELPYPWKGMKWWVESVWSPLFKAPFSCRALFSAQMLARWQQILRDCPGALLHFDSIDLALFARSTSGFRKVLNHHNCESAMAFRRSENEPNPLKRFYLRLQARKLANMERSICGAFDVNTVVSEGDAALLRAISPTAQIHVVENGVDMNYFAPSEIEEEPQSLAFTGSLDWYPNVSGMDFFVREVWPRVKNDFPDARLYVAGKNPPEQILRWSKDDSSIDVVPNPEDIRLWLAKASVFVCPILDGGGTRLKVLDAMAMANAVVSTTIGCEGLRVTDGENILVADTPQEFAGKVKLLMSNEELRHRLGRAARALVEHEYSWERIGQQLEHAYRCAF